MPVGVREAIDMMTTDEKVRVVRYVVSSLGSGFRLHGCDCADGRQEADELAECSRFCRDNPDRMSHEEVFAGLQEIIDAGRQIYP